MNQMRPEEREEYSLFYYPYASVTDDQAALLRVSALYFDKLYMLDPAAAVRGHPGLGIHASESTSTVALLEERGLAERISPSRVLDQYEESLQRLVQADLQDETFVRMCRDSGREAWELALAKVPHSLREDEATRSVFGVPLGDGREELVARPISATGQPQPPRNVYEETDTEGREYRWAVFDVAVGESILINHAILGGLARKRAVPVTDDDFHRKMLDYKMLRVLNLPELSHVLGSETIRESELARAFLSERRLNLPSMRRDTPIEAVLDFRTEHEQSLRDARDELYWLARTVSSSPFTPEFRTHLEHKLLPTIRGKLKTIETERDAWLAKRKSTYFKAGGAVVATIGTAVGLLLAPAAAPAVAVAGVLAFLGGALKDTPDVVDAFRRNYSGSSGWSYFLDAGS